MLNDAFASLQCSQFLVQQRNVIIVLSLVEVAGDGSSQVVLFSELLNPEASSIVTRAIGQARLIEAQLSRLLVDQKHVTVETGVLGRARAYVGAQHFSFLDRVAGDVSNKPERILFLLKSPQLVLNCRCVRLLPPNTTKFLSNA